MANDQHEVFKGKDFYVPDFRVVIESKELGQQKMQDIMSVTYNDSLTDIDSFEMTVNNWEPNERRFKYSDGETFNPWKNVELHMGYRRGGGDELVRMLTGEITTLAPNFPTSGGPTLTVGALNLLHRFRTQQVTMQFLKKRDTEIARELVANIAGEVRKKAPGVDVVFDEKKAAQNASREQPIPYLVLDNKYPIVFLMERARRLGYELTVTESKGADRTVTIGFSSTRAAEPPARKLEYGVSLISFQPTLQTSQQVSQVTVRGWDPQGKTEFKATATRADLADEKVVHPVDLDLNEPNLAQKMEVIADRPIQTKPEAEDLAKSALRQLAQNIVTAKARTIGMPDLRAGTKVEIAGVGTRFSGIYLVTATTHSIGDGGYTTDFSARLEEMPKGRKPGSP